MTSDMLDFFHMMSILCRVAIFCGIHGDFCVGSDPFV